MARQFNLIPPVCEQAEYHLFQREKVEVQLPELYHKIGTYSVKCQIRVTIRWSQHRCAHFVKTIILFFSFNFPVTVLTHFLE